MESVADQINTQFEAVVGWGYFRLFFIEMDYAKNHILLHQQITMPKNMLFSTKYNKNSSYLSIRVEVNSKIETLIIDTGFPISIVDSTFYYGNKMDEFAFKFGAHDVVLKAEVMTLPLLEQLNAIGILGGDFLEQYKIHIDPFESKITFEN